MPPKRSSNLSRIAQNIDHDLQADINISSSQATSSTPTPHSVLTVDTVSNDYRRLYRDSVPIPGAAQNAADCSDDPSTLGAEGSRTSIWEELLNPDDPAAGSSGGPGAEDDERAPRYQNSDEPMKTWLPKRDVYLDELNRREGRGCVQSDRCTLCRDPLAPREATVRCNTCAPGPLRCPACLVSTHGSLPYHRVQRWNGSMFEHTTLKSLGLTIQLGHRHDEQPCSNPIPARADFSVIDLNGRHPVSLMYCGCDNAANAGDHVQQLLRFDLYPATDFEPNTAFTYALLEHYHIQSLQGKISMYDYYTSLERMTDNTGIEKAHDRYKSFMRVVAQWRHLKMLQRAGRGHDPSGVDGTSPGELAVPCPACPHPAFNLPPNWETVSDDLKYLYILIIAIDACFRLKRRDVSGVDKNPILGSGWAYFVEDTGYREILRGYQREDEISSCTGFSALDHADSKFSRGYDATGVGAVVCARHEFWLAQGVGDLQKGERYINMDYIFVCAMREHLITNKISLLDRIARFPSHVRIDVPQGSISYVIPKLHFRSHIQKGHSPYSLNYLRGAGRTDGEGIERRWWDIQPIAASTKVMGPGQRQGVLEDHWGYANWRKRADMPWTLRDRLKAALIAYAEHAALFDALTSSLLPDNVKRWASQIAAWEADPWGEDDPYIITSSGLTEAEAMQELTTEEQKASAVVGYVALHDISPLGFITMGLQIEDQKVAIKAEAKVATASKLLSLHKRRNALRRKLQKFRELQGVYMPRTVPLLAEDPSARTNVELVEDIRIGLPSEIVATHRAVVCTPRLQEMEARLREAQCHDALQDVRNQLHIINHLYRYKQTNVRHQGANTRVRADLASQDNRKARAVEKYRRARRAKLALTGPGPWERVLRMLEDKDVRGLEEDDPDTIAKRKRKRGDDPGPAEGHRTLSWIWNASDGGGDGSLADSLRVEWLKARARKMRWEEETKILLEEMLRVIRTYRYEEGEWLKRASKRTVSDHSLQEGLVAYATKQAQIRRAMRLHFISVCRDMAMAAALTSDGGTGSNEWAELSDTPWSSWLPPDDWESRSFMDMRQLDGEDFAAFPSA
ncbi:hypothetical protein ACG7TL_001721 [Trametes sanguinea]